MEATLGSAIAGTTLYTLNKVLEIVDLWMHGGGVEARVRGPAQEKTKDRQGLTARHRKRLDGVELDDVISNRRRGERRVSWRRASMSVVFNENPSSPPALLCVMKLSST